MKHNPRLNERVAALPGHARLHPAQDPKRAQGALELMWRLERALAEICGLPHVSLQPSAGSHGELAGLLLTRAYHADRGEERDQGAGARHLARHQPGLGDDGRLRGGQGRDRRAAAGWTSTTCGRRSTRSVACLMLTNPNTLGLFDENIAEIAALVHEAGGTLYYDGANLNAIMGHSRPGDMGFDIVHVNLHKSFSQPHGGGGPGAGPIAVSDRIEPFLPVPQVVRREGDNGAGPAFDLDFERPKSIGRLRGFQGNFGVFVRSYAYILSLGGDGLAEASETAVLNANYLMARLREGRAGRYLPVAFDRHCMHEFVLSGAPVKRELGVATLDLAKRLLDFGFHPPTVYFPLLVEEALMVEPTETETKEEPRRLRRGDRGDPRRGRERPRDRRATRPTRPRSAASTRSRRAAARSSASRSSGRALRQLLFELQHRGEEVAVLLTRSSTSPASKPSASASSSLGASLDLVPVDRRRGGRPLAGAQRVDGDRRLARWFWHQSTKTLPLRSTFFIFETTGRGSASRAAGRSLWRTVWSRS